MARKCLHQVASKWFPSSMCVANRALLSVGSVIPSYFKVLGSLILSIGRTKISGINVDFPRVRGAAYFPLKITSSSILESSRSFTLLLGGKFSPALLDEY